MQHHRGTLPPEEQRSRHGVGPGTAPEEQDFVATNDAAKDSPRGLLLQAGRRDGRWRRNARGETSKGAALARDRRPLREQVLDLIEGEAGTPEAVFAKLRAAGVNTVLTSVRPRCSELARMGLIKDSGRRAPGEGGRAAIVWTATTTEERTRFLFRLAAEADQGSGE